MSATWFNGSCHCGAVKFEVRTALAPAARCNCSLCRRRGALMSPMFDASELKIVAGEGTLTSYRFNTRTAHHFFCSRCGIYPFHRKRVTPDFFGVNVFCLEGFDPVDIPVRRTVGAAMQ